MEIAKRLPHRGLYTLFMNETITDEFKKNSRLIKIHKKVTNFIILFTSKLFEIS